MNPTRASSAADTISPVQVIAVASGKGGVGKTNVSVNLAVSLARIGRRVMLLDADLGLANVDVLLGIKPAYTLADVLSGERSLDEILVSGPQNIAVVPASSGVARMANLSTLEHAGIVRAFSELQRPLDVLIVDTAAGIHDSIVHFCRAAQEVLVVVCNEPAALTDAYALIKVLNRDQGISRVRILANMVQDIPEGRALFQKLSGVCERFLDVTLDLAGTIPYDDYLRKAVQRQRAVTELYPRAPAARAFQKLAERVSEWPPPRGTSGRIEFFVERLLGVGFESASIQV